jgi:uncharacterized protein
MADDLHPIPIRDLKWYGRKGRSWTIDQPIPPLESLTSVRGRLVVIHHDITLEVRGEARTIVTLCCDRCLQPFNHCLRFRTTEHICLTRESTPFRSGPHGLSSTSPGPGSNDDGLTIQLDPSGNFEPARWIYEQLSLQWPLVNRCGPHCPGPDHSGGADVAAEPASPMPIDPRWAPLSALLEVKEG